MAPRHHHRFYFRSPVLMLLVPLLFACGENDDGTTAPTTTEATTTTSTVESTTSTDSTSSTSTTTTAPTTESTTTTTESTSTSTSEGSETVEVYFSTGDGTDCSEVTAFERTIDAANGPASAAFEELLGGPTPAEEDAGASSFFSAATADAVRSVSLSDGTLTVDLDDVRADIPNASSSCGSGALTASLNATAFQFPNVEKARYLFAGSCEDFGEFIQAGSCEFDVD